MISLLKVFNECILSIDMLHLVKDFFINKNDPTEELININLASSSSNIKDVSILLDDDEDEVLSQALDSFNVSGLNTLTSDESEVEESPKKAKLGKNTVDLRHSTKDCGSSMIDTPHTSCYEKIQKINEKTPEGQKYKKGKRNKSLQNIQKNSTKKNLDFTKSRPDNFKLPTIYKYIFCESPKNIHSAEGDCLTMIRCAVKMGNYFVQWADRNACSLNHSHKQQ